MNEEDLRQNLEGLIKDAYDLGVAHANHRRLTELWSDKLDQFKEVVGRYVSYEKKTLLKGILEAIQKVCEAITQDAMRKLTGKEIQKQMARRSAALEFKNAIIAEVETL